MSSYDIAIIGGGIVGTTTALALAQKTSLKILLLDAKALPIPSSPVIQSISDGTRRPAVYPRDPVCQPLASKAVDHDNATVTPRVSLISLSSQRIFRNLNVWPKIQFSGACAYKKMHVWNAAHETILQINSADLQRAQLGYLIYDAPTQEILLQELIQYPHVTVSPACTLTTWRRDENGCELITQDGQTLKAKLVIGADGANSWVREQASIAIKSSDYSQTAIVAQIKTSLPHQATAWQKFLTTGPLAILPCEDAHTASIVWSATTDEFLRLSSMKLDDFIIELSQKTENCFGQITNCTQRLSFPLQMRHANNYVQANVTLVGDAAHTIHPLAGQGLNMGLLDAATLVDTILKALNKKRNYASYENLRYYERARKSDNQMMLSFVELIKKLFTGDGVLLDRARNFGVSLTNENAFLKNVFANYAIGNRHDLPTLANLKE